MDADNTLKAIRDIVDEVLGDDEEAHESLDDAEKLIEFAERFRALDEWLTRGGFLPAGWKGDAR